jgi:hypothetical protein
MLKPPIAYTPDLEQEEEGEAEAIEQLLASFRDIQKTVADDEGHAVRAVHAKSHGLLDGTLEVHDGLPPELAQGLFARAGTYRLMMRFSTNAGDPLDDSVALPRGLALKVLDVEGARLPAAVAASTQDFVLVNGRSFAAGKLKEFVGNLKLLAATTDKAQWAKKALSAVLRGVETALEAVGVESGAVRALGGAPNVHPLGETYYSQVPFRYGDHLAKFAVVPVSAEFTSLTGTRIAAAGKPDAIREAMNEALDLHGGTYEFRVQLCRDAETMPIENARVQWDEAESPFLTVATLHVPRQRAWSPDRARRFDDETRFSIWTGLEAHRPMGAINRARRPAYVESSDFRSRFNRCPIHEPAT